MFLLSKGDSWNPIDMKLIPIWCWLSEDEVFATNSITLLFVASPRLTAEIHSFLLLAVSSSGSAPWFVIIVGIRKNPKPICLPPLLEQPTTAHKTIPTFPTLLWIRFVYAWETTRWRIVTVAKLLVTWVKPSNWSLWHYHRAIVLIAFFSCLMIVTHTGCNTFTVTYDYLQYLLFNSKSRFCFSTDCKQHKEHELDMITLRNHAPLSWMTWLPVTFSALDMIIVCG